MTIKKKKGTPKFVKTNESISSENPLRQIFKDAKKRIRKETREMKKSEGGEK